MKKKIYLSILGMMLLFSMSTLVQAQGMEVGLKIEQNGGVAVNIQDQTSPPLDLFFVQSNGTPTTLAVNATKDDINITLTNVTGFIDGTFIGIFCPDEDRFFFAEQIGAPVGNVITLDSPIDFNFTVNDNVQPLTRDLNVDGSTTTQSFIISGAGQTSELEIDITRIMISFETDSPVALNLFGDLAKLDRGLVLRRNNGDSRNIWNVKSNGEIAQLAFDYDPHLATNPAQGQDGANFRYSFAGQEKHGVAVRIATGESLELLIQDDLSGLASFRVIAEGHVVAD